MDNRKKLAALVVGTAVATFVVASVLVSVFRHKSEGQRTYLRFVEVKQATTDPAPWGVNCLR